VGELPLSTAINLSQKAKKSKLSGGKRGHLGIRGKTETKKRIVQFAVGQGGKGVDMVRCGKMFKLNIREMKEEGERLSFERRPAKGVAGN